MKRFITFALICTMLVCLVACDGGAPANYVFKSGGVEIAIDGDADAVEDALGEGIAKIETPSCGGGAEPDREFIYSGFKFNTVNENGMNVITRIVLTDDSVSTPEGISIGSSREEVIAAYGEAYEETPEGALIYSDGDTRILIGFTDGAVSALNYLPV